MSANAESHVHPNVDIDLQDVRSRLATLRMSSVHAATDLVAVLATPPASEDLRTIQVVEVSRVGDRVAPSISWVSSAD